MKVKFNVCMAGSLGENDSYVRRPGDIVNIEDAAEAVRLIEAGIASPVAEVPEMAIAPAGEKRVKK